MLTVRNLLQTAWCVPSSALPLNHGAAHLLFKTCHAIVQFKRTEVSGCDFTRLFPALFFATHLVPTSFLSDLSANQPNFLMWSRGGNDPISMVGICWVNELNQVIHGSSTRTGPRRRRYWEKRGMTEGKESRIFPFHPQQAGRNCIFGFTRGNRIEVKRLTTSPSPE